MWLSPFAGRLKLPQDCQSVIPQYKTKSLVKILKNRNNHSKKTPKTSYWLHSTIPESGSIPSGRQKGVVKSYSKWKTDFRQKGAGREGGSSSKAGWLWPGHSPLVDNLPSAGQEVPGWPVHDPISGRTEIVTQLILSFLTCGLVQ